MKTMSKLCSTMLQPVAHVPIFCSALQYRLCYRVLSKEFEVQDETGWFGFCGYLQFFPPSSHSTVY